MSFRSRLQLVASLSAPVLAFTLGCASSDRAGEIIQTTRTAAPNIPVPYEQKIESYSAGDSDYAGLYNAFEYKATLLNSQVRDAILDRQSEYYQWDREKIMSERDKSQQAMATETTVFLSFFTPERKNDNLADTKTIWKIYLEAGGQRYEGKAKRTKELFAELAALYPYHTRWNTPYYVSFPISTGAIETQNSKLTITGPLGTRSIDFSALDSFSGPQ